MGALFATSANYVMSYCRLIRHEKVALDPLWRTKTFGELVFVMDALSKKAFAEPVEAEISTLIQQQLPEPVFAKFLESVQLLAEKDSGFISQCIIRPKEPTEGVSE
jgi:hypothetical protein